MKQWILMLFSTLWVVACSFQPQPSEPSIYMLQANIAPVRAAKPSAKVLLIAQPRAEAGFDSKRIAYTDKPSAISYYSQSEWADEPAKLIAPLLAEAIEKTAAYQAVLTQPTPVAADHRLDVELIRLQQNFLQQPSEIQLTLRVSLSDAASNTLLASRLFDEREPAPSENAYGGVQAANRALSRILSDLTAWLLAQAGGASAPP